MTREEAINQLKDFIILHRGEHGWDVSTLNALDMAIKALESKDVLDKISAEIIEKFGNCSICDWFEDYDYEENDISEYRSVGDISDIIEIINKYKAGSEE